MIKSRRAAIVPALVGLLQAISVNAADAKAENVIRAGAPITKAGAAASTPGSQTPINQPSPEPDPVKGVLPSLEGLQVLYRFNGTLAREGAWGQALTSRNSGPFASSNTPYGDDSNSVLFSVSGLASPSGPISGQGSFSLGLWLLTTLGDGYLISQRDADNDGEYVLQLSGGSVCYWDYPNGTGSNEFCSRVPVNDGRWHHIGFSRSGRILSIYVDGQLSNSLIPTTANNIKTSNGLALGYDQRDNSRFINAYLRDAFIYDRALSQQEFLWFSANKLPFP